MEGLGLRGDSHSATCVETSLVVLLAMGTIRVHSVRAGGGRGLHPRLIRFSVLS